MRDPDNVFHLAIPCRNLDEAKDFYITKMQCTLARVYEDRITLNFFGDQLVCHLFPEKVDSEPQIYPRHFGVTFRKKEDFEDLVKLVKTEGIEFVQEPWLRFEGKREKHLTFFLKDPSNNVLEFKYYFDPTMIY